MKTYNPEIPPIPEEWLALHQEARAQLAEEYHLSTGEKLPNPRMHAIFHVIVEYQIAAGLERVIGAVSRLMAEGLSRHEAVHAIASVFGELLHEGLKTKNEGLTETALKLYLPTIELLTVKKWRDRYERLAAGESIPGLRTDLGPSR